MFDKNISIVLVLFSVVLFLMPVISAYPLYASTNKIVYKQGEEMIVSGTVGY